MENQRRKRIGIQGKLIFVFTALSIIMIGGLHLNHQNKQSLAKNKHIQLTEQHTRFMDHAIRQILISNTIENQADFSKRFNSEPFILSIEIFDEKENSLFIKKRDTPIVDPTYQHQFIRPFNPSFKGKKYHGSAKISLHLHTYQDYNQSFKNSLQTFSIILFILLIASVIVIHTQFKAPHQQLCDQLRRLSDRAQLLDSKTSNTIETQEITDALKVMLSKIEEQNINLRQSRDNAQLSEQAKSNFLANMSHELRTPLNGIIGMAEILKSTTLSHEQIELLNIMSKSGDTLLELIQRILKYSQITSGHMDIYEQTHHFQKFLYELSEKTEQQILDKEITFKFLPAENLPQTLIYDQSNLKTVLEAILINAIKFTKVGTIEFTVEAKPLNDNKVLVTFSISDTGIGMSPETLQEIYTPFKQHENPMRRQHGGIGIGLSLAHIILKHMDSEIYVESDLDQGSRFHFSLVMKQAETV